MTISNVKIKIITLITAILLFFGFTVSPIHVPTLQVKADSYLTPYEELKQSEGFNELDLMLKMDITVIDLMEYWKDEKQEYPVLFVYVYNPTTKKIKDSTDNCIRIRTDDSGHWNTYNLDYVKSTEDGKYVKYIVKNLKEVYNSHPDKSNRYYDVSDIKLVCDDDRTPSTFIAGYKYLYTGKEDLNVVKEEYDVIKVENLLPMTYRNIKEGIYNYPSGQINSVAFSLDNDILEKYGDVSEIHFEYYRYKTSPIVVTDTRNGFNAHEKRNEWVGNEVKYSDRNNPMCLTWGYTFGSLETGGIKYAFGYNSYMLDFFGNKTSLLGIINNRYSKLTYSFVAPTGIKATNHDVTSKELTEWIYSYADNYLSGKDYESIEIKDGKLPAELFEDYKNEKYGYKDVHIKADTLSYKEQSSNWWNRLWGIKDSVNYETIKSVEIQDKNLTDAVFGARYLCNDAYVDELKSLLTLSELSNKTLMLFRFDLSDYSTYPAVAWGTFGGQGGSDGHAYVAHTDVFLNFSFIDFTFCKDSVATVLAVSSDTIDIIPDIQHPIVPESCDWKYWLTFILGVIFWFAVITLGLKYVVRPVLRFISKRGRK